MTPEPNTLLYPGLVVLLDAVLAGVLVAIAPALGLLMAVAALSVVVAVTLRTLEAGSPRAPTAGGETQADI